VRVVVRSGARRRLGARIAGLFLFLSCALFASPSPLPAAEPAPTLEQTRKGKIRNFPALPKVESDLIIEGYRVFAMANRFQWYALREPFPPPTLLVTGDGEYLMGHPSPPKEYFLTKKPDRLFMNVYGKETELPCRGATARPTFGAPTIVKASKTCSGESATAWIFDYVRCCFRLYQYQRQELMKLARLNLPFPDPMEQWKHAFPFPYDDPEVIAAFHEVAGIVSNAFWVAYEDEKRKILADYPAARGRLEKLLRAKSQQHSCEDFLRYIEWSEGVALYAAWEIMEALSKQPAAFPATLRQYPDFIVYAAYVNGPLKEQFQRFREPKAAPLTLDDFAMLGALTTAAIGDFVPGWRDEVFVPTVWLETLMARIPPAN